jgi:hypothetical protein
MSVVLTWAGSTPGQPQFGLATLTEHYKVQNDDGSQITAAAVLVNSSVPQLGAAHPSFAFMFCTDRHCAETGESASALDVIYMGCLEDDGEGHPVLPVQKRDSGTAIQSASSSYGSSGAILGQVSAQYYAPTNILSYISTNPVGLDESDDPTDDVEIITVVVGSGNFAPGTTIGDIATGYFSTQITHSLQNQEIVAGKYWQHVSQKTKVLIPFLVTVPSGTAFVTLSAAGTGYRIGDILTITAGGETATLYVTTLGLSQSVLTFVTAANSFTTNQISLSSTGGTGSGARFNVVIV